MATEEKKMSEEFSADEKNAKKKKSSNLVRLLLNGGFNKFPFIVQYG